MRVAVENSQDKFKPFCIAGLLCVSREAACLKEGSGCLATSTRACQGPTEEMTSHPPFWALGSHDVQASSWPGREFRQSHFLGCRDGKQRGRTASKATYPTTASSEMSPSPWIRHLLGSNSCTPSLRSPTEFLAEPSALWRCKKISSEQIKYQLCVTELLLHHQGLGDGAKVKILMSWRTRV